MTGPKVAVYPLNNMPAGMPSIYGLLEVPSVPRRYTVFFTKQSWPAAAKLAELNIIEQSSLGEIVMASALPRSIPWLDGLVRQSRGPSSLEHVM
jgi:hypothetical protein